LEAALVRIEIKVCSSGIGMSSNTTHDPPRTAGGGNWVAVSGVRKVRPPRLQINP
jgi:hypothetical protein